LHPIARLVSDEGPAKNGTEIGNLALGFVAPKAVVFGRVVALVSKPEFPGFLSESGAQSLW
jgi:hypothetical protein